MMCFGTHLRNYRNIKQTMYSLLTSLMGSFDFEDMQEVQPTLGTHYIVFRSLKLCIQWCLFVLAEN